MVRFKKSEGLSTEVDGTLHAVELEMTRLFLGSPKVHNTLE